MKYISLIVGILIILLVVAGGVLLWQRQPAPVEPTPIEPTPTGQTEPVEPTTPQEPSSVQVPEGWKTYTNEEFGFAFDYPGEWEVGLEKTNIPNVIAYLVSPEMKTSIQRYPYGGEFGDIYFIVQNFNALNLESYLQGELEDKHIISYQKIVLEQMVAYEVLSGEASLDYAVIASKDAKLYKIFLRNKNNHDDLSIDEQGIIGSFRFL